MSDGCFGGIIIARHEHYRPVRHPGIVGHDFMADLIERLDHPCSRQPTSHGFRARCPMATIETNNATHHGERVHAVNDNLAGKLAQRLDRSLGNRPRQG